MRPIRPNAIGPMNGLLGLIACVRRTGISRGGGRMAPTLEETKTRPIRTTSICRVGVISEAPSPYPRARHTVCALMPVRPAPNRAPRQALARPRKAQGIKFDRELICIDPLYAC